jgi:hypothetical protein
MYLCSHTECHVCVLSNWDGIAPRALFKSIVNSQVPAWLNWVQHTSNDPSEIFVISGIKVNTNYEK